MLPVPLMRFAPLILVLMLLIPAASQSLRADSAGDLGFLAGDWIGGRGQTRMNRYHWSAPAGSVVMGSYLVPDSAGAFRFAELILIEDTSDGTILRLMHFRSDYTTWENGLPIALRLVESRSNFARFEDAFVEQGLKGIVFRRDGDDLSVELNFAGRAPVTNSFTRVYNIE